MRHEHCKTLFSYWNTLRGERAAPERTEIEPVEIRHILGDTFILEISAQLRTISFRLAGTRLCGAYGRELKGLGFLAIWREEDNFEIAKAIARVYRNFEPALINYGAHAGEGHVTEFEMLMLPLAPAPDGNSRILGVAAPRSTPYWLGAQPVQVNHLYSIRYPKPTRADPPAVKSVAKSGDKAALTPVELAPPLAVDTGYQSGRRVAHLTVLDGGRD